MKRIFKNILSTVAVVGLFAGLAQADTVGMNTYKTNSAGTADTSRAAVNINVTDTGTRFKFRFINNSTITSSIQALYFDNSLASVLSGAPFLNFPAGVNFFQGSSAATPLLSASLGWTGTLAMVRSVGTTDNPKIANGVNNGGGEFLAVAFKKVGGAVLQDVLDLLAGSGGIVAHLTNLEGNGLRTHMDFSTLALQETKGEGDGGNHGNHGTVIPTPAAAFGGLALLGMLASSRRRRND